MLCAIPQKNLGTKPQFLVTSSPRKKNGNISLHDLTKYVAGTKSQSKYNGTKLGEFFLVKFSYKITKRKIKRNNIDEIRLHGMLNNINNTMN